jgi:hypothetical protein
MRKLRLDLDQLTVDTFDTSTTAKEKGTVFGEQCTCNTYCGQNTCPGCPTCDNTACNQNTCFVSCESCVSCGGSCFYTECGDSSMGTCDPTYGDPRQCCPQ